MVRKLGLALAIAAALFANLEPAQSANLPIGGIPFPAPAPGPFSLRTSSAFSRLFGISGSGSASLGALAAGGIIATAAVLCAYDVWLKFEGYKNWDGTPKVALARHRHHRGP